MHNQARKMCFVIGIVLLVAACAQEEDPGNSLLFTPPQDSASADTTDSSLSDVTDETTSDIVLTPDGADGADGADGVVELDSTLEVADGDSEIDGVEDGSIDTVSDMTVDTPEPAQACTGESDQTQLMSWAEAAIYKWVMETAQECFVLVGGQPGKLVEDEDFHACVAAAVATTLELSGSCSACFGDLAVCSKNFCMTACGAADPDIEENLQGCIDCQIENYCTHGFDQCTGSTSDV